MRGLNLEQITATSERYGAFKRRYRNDSAGFVRDCIGWGTAQTPKAYQEEFLRALQERRRVAVRGPHGLGKTSCAAWALLHFALTRDGEDWKVITTASAWRQLTKFLWPEVHKWARLLRWDVIGRAPFIQAKELQVQALRLRTGEAFAVASDKADLIEGAHADNLLYVFDEAKVIPDETWDAAEGALSRGECYALAISTPGEPSGRFYDIHQRRAGYEDWWVRHVRLDEAIRVGMVSDAWAEQRKAQWGEGSAVYQNRVLGEFAASEEEGVIPLAWVELANERWAALADAGLLEDGGMSAVGVDVARSGEDMTVQALRYGDVIAELRRTAREDTMKTAGRVAGLVRERGGRAVVDVVGLGAGVVDRLREQGLDTLGFNAGARTDVLDASGELGFVDRRSAAWWGLRELLEPGGGSGIALPPDDRLIGDLTAPRWRVMSGGKIKVESKDEIKRRLKRSTDDGDSVVMAFWRGEDEGKADQGGGFLF